MSESERRVGLRGQNGVPETMWQLAVRPGPLGKILLALCREVSGCSARRDHPQNCSERHRKDEDHRSTLPIDRRQPAMTLAV